MWRASVISITTKNYNETVRVIIEVILKPGVLSPSDSGIAIRVADSRFLKNSVLIRARFLWLIHKLIWQSLESPSYTSAGGRYWYSKNVKFKYFMYFIFDNQ